MRRVVVDTNIFVSALLSQRGASYQILRLIDRGIFQLCLSVPLVLEYEDAASRVLDRTLLTEADLSNILDYVCQVGSKHRIYFLWRPFLRDAKDDMVLELAVTAECDTIVTFNSTDFAGVEIFGIEIMTPQAFLKQIGQNI